MAAVPGGGFGFMVISIVAFVILGSVLEGIPAIVLFGPLLFPIAKAVGIHEVHYAMVVILAMGIGLFAPPFGVGYYAACAIGQVVARRGHAADLALSRRAAGRAGGGGRHSLAVDGIPVILCVLSERSRPGACSGDVSGRPR